MIFLNRTKVVDDLNKLNTEASAHNSKIIFLMRFGADDIRFTLSEALSTIEEAALDVFLSNFVDVDLAQKTPKIYDVVKTEFSSNHHHVINYSNKIELKEGLIPLRTSNKGEVVRVDWYRTLNAEFQPTDLVMYSVITYNRDPSGFAMSRMTTRTWINRDGTENEEKKVTFKYYFVNPSDSIDEGTKRRSHLVSSITLPIKTFMTEVLAGKGYEEAAIVLKGRAFLDDYEAEFGRFISNSSSVTDPADPDFGKKKIVVQFMDSTAEGKNVPYAEWLDLAPASLGGLITIRNYLISEFTI